jgi:2-amino-4-hydroxy-6-hydroxymethyldihydropteridine diphosphokinase
MDVLLYDDMQLHEQGLTIPHPQMHLRAFVLQPLLEIARDVSIPGLGQAQRSLQSCQDQVLERLPHDGL